MSLKEEDTKLRAQEAARPEAGEETRGEQLPFNSAFAPAVLVSGTPCKVGNSRTRSVKSSTGWKGGILPRRTSRNRRGSCQATVPRVTQGIVVPMV